MGRAGNPSRGGLRAVPVPGVNDRRSGTGRDRGQRLGQGPAPPSVVAAGLVPDDVRWAVLRCGPGILQLRGVLRDLRSPGRTAPGVGGLLPAGGHRGEARLGRYFFRISLALHYCETPPVTGKDGRLLNCAVVLLYACFPACAAIVIFWPALFTLRRDGRTSRRSVLSTVSRWIAGTALLLTAAAVAGPCAVNRDLKASLEIDYCAENRIRDGRNHEGRESALAALLVLRESRRRSALVPYGSLAVRYVRLSANAPALARVPAGSPPR